MRRVVPLLLIATLGLGACGGEKTPKASAAFCRAVDKYNSELERAQKRGKIDPERELERVSEMARTAPKAIKKDAEAFRDALQQVADDPSIKDDPELEERVDNVNRFANKACGLYDSGSGF